MKSVGFKWGICIWGLDKFNISMPFSPTFSFVPLLPVPFLLKIG